MNKQFSGIRSDIGHFTIDMRVSNICRIFKFENKQYEYLNDKKFLPQIKDIDGLFGKKNVYIYVKNKIKEDTANQIIEFRKQYDLIIISDDDNYIKDNIIKYHDLENKYKMSIPLWEDRTHNIANKPEVYTKTWVTGRELKRKHPKFFEVGNKRLKIGYLWKKPSQVGFHGRPEDENNGFIDTFEIRDKEGNVYERKANWGAILSNIMQRIKDTPQIYYNTGEKLIIYGHSKKEDKWINIVEYDAIRNYWKYIPNKRRIKK